jgi:hypothetical protein
MDKLSGGSINVTKYIKGYIEFIVFIDFIKEMSKIKIIKEKRYIQKCILSTLQRGEGKWLKMFKMCSRLEI